MARKQAPSRFNLKWYDTITECRKGKLSDITWCRVEGIPSITCVTVGCNVPWS